MISTTTPTDTKITVTPSDRIFLELGNNTYDYKDLLSELIDNALAARRHDTPLEVSIIVYVDENNLPTTFVVSDNAAGISAENLPLAISPAALHSENSLNEHGLGMKQAIAALGKLKYLATKTPIEDKARVVTEFKFGDIDVSLADFDGISGTEIAVEQLRSIVQTHAGTITRSIIPYLGARYRRFLRPANRQLTLTLSIKSATTKESQYQWKVEEVKPVYFHPSTRENRPVILAHDLTGDRWQAELTFGYAPKEEAEYDELGLEVPNKFHPYKVSLTRQGLDVVLHDRVILFHQLAQLAIVPSTHNDYNVTRGEINLLAGFSTAITKNSMIQDRNFSECIDQVRQILTGTAEGPDGKKHNYLKTKTYPEDIPEKLLRDRLVEWLKNNPMTKKITVNTEYVVEGIEGSIDIFADNEAWELKVQQASALDVYQLFMYMDVGEIHKGYLVAYSFSTGAQVAADWIHSHHKKDLVLAPRDQFPINHPPSQSEREEYY